MRRLFVFLIVVVAMLVTSSAVMADHDGPAGNCAEKAANFDDPEDILAHLDVGLADDPENRCS